MRCSLLIKSCGVAMTAMALLQGRTGQCLICHPASHELGRGVSMLSVWFAGRYVLQQRFIAVSQWKG